MKIKKNGTVVYDGADIAEAFGMPNPYTRCTCKHKRYEHRRVILVPGPAPEHKEEHYECEAWDRRTTTGTCKCPQFTEPEEKNL